MKGIILANKVSTKCLVRGLGHDFVTVERDRGGSTESWIECWECGLTLDQLERQEENCTEHELKCVKCGFPMLKDRVIPEHPEDEEEEPL